MNFNFDFDLKQIANLLLSLSLVSSLAIFGYLDFEFYKESLNPFLAGCSSFFVHGLRLALAVAGVVAWKNGKLGGAFFGMIGSAILSYHVHCQVPDLAAHFASEEKMIAPLSTMFYLFDWASLFLEIRLGIAASPKKSTKKSVKAGSTNRKGKSAKKQLKKGGKAKRKADSKKQVPEASNQTPK